MILFRKALLISLAEQEEEEKRWKKAQRRLKRRVNKLHKKVDRRTDELAGEPPREGETPEQRANRLLDAQEKIRRKLFKKKKAQLVSLQKKEAKRFNQYVDADRQRRETPQPPLRKATVVRPRTQLESDQRLRSLERAHSSAPTTASAIRLSHAHVRAGDHNRAYDTLLPHADHLSGDGRELLSKAASGVYHGLKQKHDKEGGLEQHELHRAGDAKAHVLPHHSLAKAPVSTSRRWVSSSMFSKDKKHRLAVTHIFNDPYYSRNDPHRGADDLSITTIDHGTRNPEWAGAVGSSPDTYLSHRAGGPHSVEVHHHQYGENKHEQRGYFFNDRSKGDAEQKASVYERFKRDGSLRHRGEYHEPDRDRKTREFYAGSLRKRN